MLNFLRTFIVLGLVFSLETAHAQGAGPDAVRLGEAFAVLKYQPGDKDAKLSKVRALAQDAAALAGRMPEAAEPLYWQAQILCLEAELMHSPGSLDRMRQARALLEKAEALDPRSSAVKALLGSLYYEVPGWPIGFGSDRKAGDYLRQAVAVEPDGMDANYFMGDFLLQRRNPADALSYLEKALALADSLPPSHVVAGRRTEIVEALGKARKAGS